MYNIKIICKGFLNIIWYENVESFIIDESKITIRWWSIASQKYILSYHSQEKIKKIIVDKQ